MPGRQSPDAGEGRLGRGNEAEVQVAEDGGRLDGRRLGQPGPQRGQTRREGGASSVGRVVQTPHPEGVHGQEQGALPSVPQRHGEGAPQAPEEGRPLHLVQAREQTGLGLGLVEAGDGAQLVQVEQVAPPRPPRPHHHARSGLDPRRTDRSDPPRHRCRPASWITRPAIARSSLPRDRSGRRGRETAHDGECLRFEKWHGDAHAGIRSSRAPGRARVSSMPSRREQEASQEWCDSTKARP